MRRRVGREDLPAGEGCLDLFPAGSGAAYQVKLLYDPATANNSGSAVPVKLQLLNAAGANESAAGITVTVAVCRARTLLMA